MATRKKKTKDWLEDQADQINEAFAGELSKLTEADIPRLTGQPHIVKGSHLTVTTYPDGRSELVWDDEALLKEVQEAIMQYELSQKKPAVRAKANKTKQVK